MKILKPLKHWLGGIRLYIAAASLLAALEMWWWAQAVYGGSNLMAIRLQQMYGWTALILLAAALLIGPLLKIFPRFPGAVQLRDARRLLGIAAAGFATLHVGINYIGLFGSPNPLQLPDFYQRAFLLGLAALVILILMAITSFDAAFKRMGPWWFRLHRLVYAAVFFIVMHAFMVGTYATTTLVLCIVAAVAVLLLALHAVVVLRPERPRQLQVITLTLAIFFAVAILNYGLTQRLGRNVLMHDASSEMEGHRND